MRATVQLGAHESHVHDAHHAHGVPHSHEGGHVHQHGQLGHGAPVLDIGGDIGALLLYTTEALEGLEIEVSPVAEPDRRTHTEVLRRTVGGQTFWAAVYAELPAGDYRVWHEDPSAERLFTVRGGEVSELDWR